MNIDFIMKTKSILISLWLFYVVILYTILNIQDNNYSAQNLGLSFQDSKRIRQEPCECGNIPFGDASLKLGRNEKYNWSYTGKLHRDFKQFAPALNMTEYSLYIDLIATFKAACEAYNLTYMLYAGSVLGAYRHHGFIPWDDDFDCIVDVSEKTMLNKALSSIPGYTLYDSRNNFGWKFFSNSVPKGPYGWSWPFIDIFFFTTNETDFYEVTQRKTEYTGPITDGLPTEKGIFENMIMPVPHNMKAFLNKIYSMDDSCASKWWDHKAEMYPELKTTRIPCKKFFGVYPLVLRFNSGNNTFEALTLGHNVLYSVERPNMKLLKP